MGNIRIGTRESELAVWQATQVTNLLAAQGISSEQIFIKSEGDIDLTTPLYELGVTGIFTRSLDIALLTGKIDVAVHSFKDVPTQLPKGIQQAAVLKRGPVNDLAVFKNEGVREKFLSSAGTASFTVATSSTRRKAQWLHTYPHHVITNLRGNVNTRLGKLENENWDIAIFAQAGLERINLRPEASVVLDWMVPAPAQGAIVIVSRTNDQSALSACQPFNDQPTDICTSVERAFLRKLLGGCSTPISALATIEEDTIHFTGTIHSLDGREKIEITRLSKITDAPGVGEHAAEEALGKGAKKIVDSIRHVAN